MKPFIDSGSFVFRFTFFLFLCISFLAVLPCQVEGADRADLRILFLTDLHLGPDNDQDKAMVKMIEEVNAEKDSYDLAVITGDICNMGSDEELKHAKMRFDSLEMKYLIIPGNHETTWSESACRTFNQLWGNDRFELRLGRFYLIGFNTGPYMKMGHGHTKAEDLHWLDKKLKENNDPETIVLVFSHYPLLDDLKNKEAVLDILRKYNVAASFSGHWHQLNLFDYGGIVGLQGRPMTFSKEDMGGYNVIEIRGDQLALIPRETGKPEGEPFFSFKIGDPGVFETARLGILPKNVHIDRIRSDEATIFGGAAIQGNRLVYANSIGQVKACTIEYNEQGQAVALKDQWKTILDHSVYSSPLLTEDRVIIGDTNNRLVGLDASNGNQVWEIPATSPVTGDGVLHDGFLYMGLGSDEFCKIDPKTGKKIWSFKGVDGRFQAAPAIGYGDVVFGAWNRNLYCLDEKTGELRWTWTVEREGNLFSPGNVIPVISPDHVIVVAPDRIIRCLDRATGTKLWETKEYHVRESMGTSPDGKVAYAKTMEGAVLAIDAMEKNAIEKDKLKLIWNCGTGTSYDHVATPLFLNGNTLFHGSPEGNIAAINVESGKRLWKYCSGNSAVNRFSVDEKGNVWFTLIEGAIYRIKID